MGPQIREQNPQLGCGHDLSHVDCDVSTDVWLAETIEPEVDVKRTASMTHDKRSIDQV
jgi:hypothetical protein